MFKLEVDNKRGISSRVIVILVVVVSLFIVGSVIWWFKVNIQLEDQYVFEPVLVPAQNLDDNPEQNISSAITENELEFDSTKLQKVLDSWTSNKSGEASVVLMNMDGNVLASINKEKVYFAASIYKLYVAFAGYLQIDSGNVNPNEVYVNGNTREECLDLMIRESDSPCAEKLWVELGKQELTDQLMDYGISNTSMVNITTTSYDAAVMLSKILLSDELSKESQEKLLQSMENQVYRDALNAGFSPKITVYNKIGFRELVEYHDTAIIEFEDGRRLIVSVLTENVGSKNIAALATAIEETIDLQNPL